MSEHTTIRNTDDLIEAFRAVKTRLGLSNEFCDTVGGLTTGHTDKVLGPTRAKNISPMTLDTFLEVFAVELHMVVNLDAVKRMEARWEQRAPDRVRLTSSKISRILIGRAKPVVLREMGQIGGQVTAHKMTHAQRRASAQRAARARWDAVRAKQGEIR